MEPLIDDLVLFATFKNENYVDHDWLFLKHYVEVRKDFISSPRELQTQKIGHVW